MPQWRYAASSASATKYHHPSVPRPTVAVGQDSSSSPSSGAAGSYSTRSASERSSADAPPATQPRRTVPPSPSSSEADNRSEPAEGRPSPEPVRQEHTSVAARPLFHPAAIATAVSEFFQSRRVQRSSLQGCPQLVSRQSGSQSADVGERAAYVPYDLCDSFLFAGADFSPPLLRRLRTLATLDDGSRGAARLDELLGSDPATAHTDNLIALSSGLWLHMRAIVRVVSKLVICAAVHGDLSTPERRRMQRVVSRLAVGAANYIRMQNIRRDAEARAPFAVVTGDDNDADRLDDEIVTVVQFATGPRFAQFVCRMAFGGSRRPRRGVVTSSHVPLSSPVDHDGVYAPTAFSQSPAALSVVDPWAVDLLRSRQAMDWSSDTVMLWLAAATDELFHVVSVYASSSSCDAISTTGPSSRCVPCNVGLCLNFSALRILAHVIASSYACQRALQNSPKASGPAMLRFFALLLSFVQCAHAPSRNGQPHDTSFFGTFVQRERAGESLGSLSVQRTSSRLIDFERGVDAAMLILATCARDLRASHVSAAWSVCHRVLFHRGTWVADLAHLKTSAIFSRTEGTSASHRGGGDPAVTTSFRLAMACECVYYGSTAHGKPATVFEALEGVADAFCSLRDALEHGLFDGELEVGSLLRHEGRANQLSSAIDEVVQLELQKRPDLRALFGNAAMLLVTIGYLLAWIKRHALDRHTFVSVDTACYHRKRQCTQDHFPGLTLLVDSIVEVLKCQERDNRHSAVAAVLAASPRLRSWLHAQEDAADGYFSRMLGSLLHTGKPPSGRSDAVILEWLTGGETRLLAPHDPPLVDEAAGPGKQPNQPSAADLVGTVGLCRWVLTAACRCGADDAAPSDEDEVADDGADWAGHGHPAGGYPAAPERMACVSLEGSPVWEGRTAERSEDDDDTSSASHRQSSNAGESNRPSRGRRILPNRGGGDPGPRLPTHVSQDAASATESKRAIAADRHSHSSAVASARSSSSQSVLLRVGSAYIPTSTGDSQRESCDSTPKSSWECESTTAAPPLVPRLVSAAGTSASPSRQSCGGISPLHHHPQPHRRPPGTPPLAPRPAQQH